MKNLNLAYLPLFALLFLFTACSTRGRSSYDQIELVKTQLRLNIGKFNGCYRKELSRGSKASGQVTVEFDVDVYGNVVKADVEAPETFSRAFIICMKNTLGYMQFEDLYNRNDVNFSQTFEFDRRKVRR